MIKKLTPERLAEIRDVAECFRDAIAYIEYLEIKLGEKQNRESADPLKPHEYVSQGHCRTCRQSYFRRYHEIRQSKFAEQERMREAGKRAQEDFDPNKFEPL